MGKKLVGIIIAVIINLSLLTTTAYAVPSSMGEIPILLGSFYESELTENAEKGDIKLFNDEKYGMQLKNKEYKCYSSMVSLEKMFKFYRAKLKAKQYVNENSVVNPQSLNTNETTSVIYYEPGHGGVIFEWQKKEANGDISCFSMAINNSVGYTTLAKAETVLYIFQSTYSKDAVADNVTQLELDIPIYSQAVFSTEKSFSGFGGYYHYVFTTSDDVQIVADFYSQHLKVISIKYQTSKGETGYSFMHFDDTGSTLSVCEKIEDGSVEIIYMTVKGEE